ncbi:MAG: YncE family protein [Candidatus Micrarchaeia archaeon]
MSLNYLSYFIKNLKYKKNSEYKKISCVTNAQSTIEYLFLYGLAILAIALVVFALFKLDLFSNLTGSSCIGSTGFLCSNPIMNSSGYLAASIGSAVQSINIIAVGCSGSDVPPSSANFIYLSPQIILQPQSNITQLFHCPINANSPLGASFSGTLWLKYYNNTNQKIMTLELGAVSVKVDYNSPIIKQAESYAIQPLAVSISPYNGVFNESNIITINAIVSGGNPPYSYQWYNDTTGTPIAILGANTPTLKLNAMTLPFEFNSLTGITSLQNNTALAVDNESNNIYVINTKNDNLVNSINIASDLYSIAQNDTYVFASSYTNNTIFIFNTINFNVIKMIHIKTPGGIVALQNSIFVANVLGNSIDIVNTSSDSIIRIISGFDKPLSLSINGNYLFVINSGNSTISIYNMTTNSIVYTLSNFFEPRGLAIKPDAKNYIYIANHKKNNWGNVSVFDYNTNIIVENITSVYQPTSVSFNYNGSSAYILNNTNIFIFNQSSNKVNSVVRASNSIFRYFVSVKDSSQNSIVINSTIGNFVVENV